MSTIVFFLGAGASSDSDAPLVSNFIERAWSLAKDGIVDSTDITKIDALQKEASYRNLDPNNIENLLLVAEDRNWSNNKSMELSKAVERVIADTLEATISFPIQGGALKPSSLSYEEFARLIGGIRRAAVSNSVILMTVNYDVCLDVAVLASGFRPYYCLNENRGPHPTEVSVLKLHGALNWRGCVILGCGNIDAIYHVDDFFKGLLRARKLTPQDGNRIHLRFRDAFPNDRCSRCGNLLQSPLIVPPIWDKTRYHSNMRILWNCAESNLREASHLIVVGYSWSDADQPVNSLLSLALDNANSRVLIFDPDTDALERARKVFRIGPDSHRVETFRNTFEKALPIIANAIQ